jgi:hypothetical protein
MDVAENGALGFGDCQFQGNHYHPVDLHGGFVFPVLCPTISSFSD